MSYFVVNYCGLRACQHWRINEHCVKNGMSIPKNISQVMHIHNSSVCEVRRQVDKYRLEHLLEE